MPPADAQRTRATIEKQGTGRTDSLVYTAPHLRNGSRSIFSRHIANRVVLYVRSLYGGRMAL